MCGICGEYAFNAPPPDPDVLTAMRDALIHRGPDDAGLFLDGPIGLGHRRLSIIDLSPLGRQPMTSADGSTTMVFNGEIYNHAAIRQELEASGVAFRGGSDTETAVNAVAVFGLKAALARFRGMFALAVWHAPSRSLTLCRDRVGVKPLYYALTRERLLFGSEPRALLAHPAFVPALDLERLAGHLTAGYFAGTGTVFAGMRKLAPGAWLRVGPDGAVREGRYWSLDAVRRGSFGGTFEDAVEETRSVLREAFGLRLVADVPVGHFLSGGLDSALVAAVLATDHQVRPEAFTIGFAEAAFDETGPAGNLAERLGLPHFRHLVDEGQALSVLEDFCEIYDEPFGDPSGIPTAILARFAAKRVKVALSADGGDEQYCGYTGYVRYPDLWRRARAVPAPLRRLLATALGWGGNLAGPLAAWAGLGRKPHVAARLAKLSRLVRADTPQALAALYAEKGFPPALSRALLGLTDPAPEPPPWPENLGEAGLTDRLMRQDFAAWLPEDILLKVDRATMHASLESRDPLLDHRVAELAFSLPLSFLANGNGQKRLPRRLLTDLLGPQAVPAGPKRGFDIPLYRWLKGPWRARIQERLHPERLRSVGILDPELTAAVATRFFTGQGGDPARIWLLYNIQAWAERWYAQPRRPV